MAEHTCPGPSQRPAFRETFKAIPFGRPSRSSGSGLPKPGRAAPPQIDLSAANRSYVRQDQLTPASSGSNSRSVSPGTPHSTRRFRFRMPPRSATSPLPRQTSPPSPALSNLDCAFPPFPSTKSRSTTPTESRPKAKQEKTPLISAERPDSELGPHFAPISPKVIGSKSILQRMNTIAPGPFGVALRKNGGLEQPQDSAGGQSHERTATSSSTKDVAKAPNSLNRQGLFPPVLIPGSERPSVAMVSNDLASPKPSVDRDGMPLPVGPAPPRPARPDQLATFVLRHASMAEEPTKNMLRQENRSQTFPIGNEGQSAGAGPTGPLPRRPSEPASLPRLRRPTVKMVRAQTFNDASIDKIDSGYMAGVDHPLPLESQNNNTRLLAARGGLGSEHVDKKPEDKSPLPNRRIRESEPSSNPHHTPTESVSSNESYGSDTRTTSSSSSPPLSNISGRPGRKPSNSTNINNLMSEIQSSMEALSPKKMPGPVDKGSTPSFSRPLYARPSQTHAQTAVLLEAPESPMDPAVQRGLLTPQVLPQNKPPTALALQRPEVSDTQRRQITTKKGNCRGCGEPIKGRSVSSADGRLTGRYHKQCFVCKTCKEPFQTSDFYVINNDPYCERHYHRLNNSMCQTCDQGIEGHYLETEKKQKFHRHCFTCQDCHTILGDDYFELGNKDLVGDTQKDERQSL
ncbi:MAG: hypothetical protein M1827_004414 [Pycnora praestabilis]|nr:MAG: hypothetical protein M1827_004414 [Pycnora praestabilis]